MYCRPEKGSIETPSLALPSLPQGNNTQPTWSFPAPSRNCISEATDRTNVCRKMMPSSKLYNSSTVKLRLLCHGFSHRLFLSPLSFLWGKYILYWNKNSGLKYKMLSGFRFLRSSSSGRNQPILCAKRAVLSSSFLMFIVLQCIALAMIMMHHLSLFSIRVYLVVDCVCQKKFSLFAIWCKSILPRRG